MSILSSLSMRFFRRTQWIDIDMDQVQKMKTLAIKNLLVERGISIYARLISKCSIDVYVGNGKDVKKEINNTHRILNVRPNPNELATPFWNRVISEMFREGEALVVFVGDNMYLADTFDVDESILYGKTYSNVCLKDNQNNQFRLNKAFSSSDVMYLELGDWDAIELLNSFYKEYDAAIESALSGFVRSNYKKIKLKTPQSTIPLQTPNGEKIDPAEYVQAIVGNYFSNKHSAVRLSGGFDIEEFNNESPKSESTHSKEIQNFGNQVAASLGIPLDIYWGTTSDKSLAMDSFITVGLSYPMRIIQDGLTASLLDLTEYKNGSRIRYNKHTLKHISILDLSKNIDKLISVGYSFNMVQDYADEPRINEPWADEHHITKNYMRVADMDKGKEVNK